MMEAVIFLTEYPDKIIHSLVNLTVMEHLDISGSASLLLGCDFVSGGVRMG